MSITAMLFRLARLSADGRALSKGPEALAKRLVRKAALKPWGKAVNKRVR